MVAMQLSHDPLVRASVRTAFQERAKLRVNPTKKGMKVKGLFTVVKINTISKYKKERNLCSRLHTVTKAVGLHTLNNFVFFITRLFT